MTREIILLSAETFSQTTSGRRCSKVPNKHAEQLRANWLAHKGKKTLTVRRN
jgi:hypothetical protein